MRKVPSLAAKRLTALKAPQATFAEMDMRSVEIQGAHLEKADFRKCKLQRADMRGTNFSEALWPNPAGGLARRRVNYSQMALSRDAASRPRLGARLAAIARTVEEGFGRPQDIEGVVAGEDIYLVQSRPQPGIE